MIYSRLRLLASGSGTFTASSSLDWSNQFDAASVSLIALPTVAGEVQLGSLTTGVCVDMGWRAKNPYDFSIWVEASSTAHTQILMNGKLIELSASALQLLSAVRGYNVLKITRSVGPIIATGQVLSETSLSPWRSLYPTGSDPFGAGGLSGGPIINNSVIPPS